MTDCPFCVRIRAGNEGLEANELAVALTDGYPVSPGHTLIVPRRHEPDYFRLTEEEQTAILRLVRLVQERLARDLEPAAFNVGVNSLPAAGQTIPHADVHVIPRFEGDFPDPRAGSFQRRPITGTSQRLKNSGRTRDRPPGPSRITCTGAGQQWLSPLGTRTISLCEPYRQPRLSIACGPGTNTTTN